MTITIHEGYDSSAIAGEVAVYWNIPKKIWSIRVGKKVVASADELTLVGDCEFYVNRAMWLAGYEGTGKRGKKRNVVAWVNGKIADGEVVLDQTVPRRRVTFRFFERAEGDFFDAASGETVTQAGAVRFDRNGHCWI